ncbi:MAG: HDOD domain-containing protein [Spirochaetia bacterium]|jgi:HD-like signal output (HDOD) protein
MSPRINIVDIQRAVRNSIPLVFRLTSLPPESFPLIDRILEMYLAELGQEKLLEPLSYCVKELISNAQKANAKRIYFEEHGLEISRGEDYERGMKDFIAEMSSNLAHFVQQLRERRLAIDVTFHATGDSFMISVSNSTALTAAEQKRINDRIVRARAFHSFFEALEASFDSTEGAGLGIMILLQFLKRIGLGEEALSIRTEGGKTVASIVIPISEVHLDQIRVLTEVLVRDIESLPHFPENIQELIRLTDDPNTGVVVVANRISRDPTLTAELLRHVNSAYYGLPSRTNSILQAVKFVGMRSLHHLLYSFGFQMVFGARAGLKALWEHSFRTAFYAFLLARDLTGGREILDDVYVAGILHDLGFIVVTSLHPRTQQKMRKFSKDKNIPPGILEKFSFGLNHADIGALIAQKWNFPDQLVEGIKYHHDPLLASRKCRDIVFCVYLANAVCDLERGLISYEQIEKPVLGEFGIRTKAQFLDRALRLQRLFEEQRAKPARA